MRRQTNVFYKELGEIRSAFGQAEYSREQIVPSVIGLLKRHQVREDELYRDAAIAILDRVEGEDDSRSQRGLFDGDEHVKLGDANRIKRKRMNLSQLLRRKDLIDRNKLSQDRAWAAETEWLEAAINKLEGFSGETTLEDLQKKPEEVS